MAAGDLGQELLKEADQALAEGDYAACVRKSVEAYQRLIEQRPDLVARPRPRQTEQGPLIPDMPRTMPSGPWPSTMGVRMTFDDAGQPLLTFEKERFAMGEAIGYYEYVRDLLRMAQKG